MVNAVLSLVTILLLVPSVALAELQLPAGFTAQVYVTGEGFENGVSQSAAGVPAATTLGVDHRGVLYLARSGRRYFAGEVDDIFPVYRVPVGGARLTPQTEARYLYGPPLPNPQVAAIRRGGELFVTTFDRERQIGVLYRIADGRAELVAGGTPEQGARALLKQPEGAAADGAGNLYVADREQGVIVKLDPSGRVLDPAWMRVTRPRILAFDAHGGCGWGRTGPPKRPGSAGRVSCGA